MWLNCPAWKSKKNVCTFNSAVGCLKIETLWKAQHSGRSRPPSRWMESATIKKLINWSVYEHGKCTCRLSEWNSLPSESFTGFLLVQCVRGGHERREWEDFFLFHLKAQLISLYSTSQLLLTQPSRAIKWNNVRRSTKTCFSMSRVWFLWLYGFTWMRFFSEDWFAWIWSALLLISTMHVRACTASRHESRLVIYGVGKLMLP